MNRNETRTSAPLLDSACISALKHRKLAGLVTLWCSKPETLSECCHEINSRACQPFYFTHFVTFSFVFDFKMAPRNYLNTYSGPEALRDYFDPDCQPMLPLVEIPPSLNPFYNDGVRIHAKMMSMHPANNVKLFPGMWMLQRCRPLTKYVFNSIKHVGKRSTAMQVKNCCGIFFWFHSHIASTSFPDQPRD